METLLEILNSIKPGIDFSKEDDLITRRVLDSLAIVSLVAEICDKFDVEITPLDIVPENFKNAQAIMNLIKKAEDD